MTYGKLRGNLMAYEQNHINWYNKEEKKKTMAFIAETTKIKEDVDENPNEG